MFDLSPSFSSRDSAARRQKGFRYVSHRPGDLGMDPAREIGTSNWIFSYADMMNSMVVFLVLLLSFASVNYGQLKQVSQAMRETSGAPQAPAPQTPLEQVGQALEEAHIEGVSFEKNAEAAALTIKDWVLFESGHAYIADSAKAALSKVFESLRSLPQSYRFEIEGHTDDNPIATFEYASNWELSAARALAVLRWMEELGFASERLSFHAFGEHQPLVPNRDEQGNPIAQAQTKNRRAVIKILPYAQQS